MTPMDPIDDDEPTEDELREAEALARALDRGTGTSELPEDALETAALLRYAHGEGDLADNRKKAIFEDVLATAKPRPHEEAAKSPAWLVIMKWLVPTGVLAAAAVWAIVALNVNVDTDGTPGDGAPDESAVLATTLPSPGVELLRAQARAASEDAEDATLLASAMQSYRGDMYAALEQRYGE